jgi:hypothetical protein
MNYIAIFEEYNEKDKSKVVDFIILVFHIPEKKQKKS